MYTQQKQPHTEYHFISMWKVTEYHFISMWKVTVYRFHEIQEDLMQKHQFDPQ